MKWLEALKQWNEKQGGRWTIPKKGSPEYDEVRALQGMPSQEPVDEEARRIVDEAIAQEQPKKKTRKPKAKAMDE
jgi:hypothetical protein